MATVTVTNVPALFIRPEITFWLNDAAVNDIRSRVPRFGFNGLGEMVYYRTYSRIKEDGTKEEWADTVLRVINGIFRYWKNHLMTHHLAWDEEGMQAYATEMAIAMFEMEWMPPGRGMWACGAPFVDWCGSAALNNCAFVSSEFDLADAAQWAMQMLMYGVGVGYDTKWCKVMWRPCGDAVVTMVVPDSSQGWALSVYRLIASYYGDKPKVVFNYDEIREAGAPIKGFGGTASGYKPLEKLHERVRQSLDDYVDGKYDSTRTVVDIMNSIGVCVVAGNVRRYVHTTPMQLYTQHHSLTSLTHTHHRHYHYIFPQVCMYFSRQCTRRNVS